MSMEGIARLFVGIGFLWIAIVLIVGLAGGFDKPYGWFKLLEDTSGWNWTRPVYLALALFVVPVGMVTLLRDILNDPVALWVKWSAPGAFLAIYAFFLAAALPDVGGPLFQWIETVSPGAPAGSAGPPAPAGTGAWLVRFAFAFAVLAGVPGIVGAVVGLLTGSKAGVRRK